MTSTPRGPRLNQDDTQRLRDSLSDSGYTVDTVLDLIGPAGQAALTRNSAVAADVALATNTSPAATLTRLFILQQQVPLAAARAALDVTALAEAGILAASSTGGHIGALVDIRPYASEDDGASGWIVSDHSATLDTRAGAPRPDHVLGVSPASTTLAQLTIRTPVRRALDLGTGCGVQALHLARHAERVVATDLNPRALDMARITLDLNSVRADLREGSLYEPVAADAFDLIITNPPFVMSPPHDGAGRLTYREANLAGDDLMRLVVTDGAARLADGGTLQVLGNWAHLSGTPWDERLHGWIAPTGCDALVLQREVLDPYEYIEIWLADAGLAGTRDYLPRYREWLDYFRALGIEAIGMGWLTLRKAGRPEPVIRIEDWPHAVEQPVGPAIDAHLAATATALFSDADLLAATWRMTPDVIQETIGEPGAAHPSHVVLRQQRGLRRAVEVNTALGGVLGACDGELALGTIVDAVARILVVDPAALVAEVVPRVRALAAEAWLTPEDRTG